MLLRFAYLAVTHAFAALRLLPMSDRAKDAEILALRHELAVLERQLGSSRVRFTPADLAFLAALLQPLPRTVLRRLRLLVRPDTALGWHRNVMRRRHAKSCRPKRPGRPRTLHSIRALVLRLVRDSPSWGYRRVHGELATLGIKIAASTVWEILNEEGIDPAPQRHTTTWADFLRSQAQGLLACDFIETVTLSGQRLVDTGGMSFDPVTFAAHYRSLSGHGRREALYGLEAQYSPELLGVLFAIAADQEEYDLARIEAVKVLGLSAGTRPTIEARVLAFIIELAAHDPDDDVRLHSLLALEWLPTAASVNERLRSITETDPNPLVRDTAQAFLDDALRPTE